MHGRDVRRTRVDELAIHLIREQVEVVLLHEVANLVHLLLRVEVAGRVVRIADQDSLRAFVDQLLKFLHLRQTKALVDGGRDRTDNRSSRNRKAHVVGVRRLRNDDLVTGIQTAHESEKYRLRTA